MSNEAVKIYRAVELKAPGIIERTSVKEPVITGSGKTAIAVDTVAKQHHQNESEEKNKSQMKSKEIRLWFYFGVVAVIGAGLVYIGLWTTITYAHVLRTSLGVGVLWYIFNPIFKSKQDQSKHVPYFYAIRDLRLLGQKGKYTEVQLAPYWGVATFFSFNWVVYSTFAFILHNSWYMYVISLVIGYFLHLAIFLWMNRFLYEFRYTHEDLDTHIMNMYYLSQCGPYVLNGGLVFGFFISMNNPMHIKLPYEGFERHYDKDRIGDSCVVRGSEIKKQQELCVCGEPKAVGKSTKVADIPVHKSKVSAVAGVVGDEKPKNSQQDAHAGRKNANQHRDEKQDTRVATRGRNTYEASAGRKNSNQYHYDAKQPARAFSRGHYSYDTSGAARSSGTYQTTLEHTVLAQTSVLYQQFIGTDINRDNFMSRFRHYHDTLLEQQSQLVAADGVVDYTLFPWGTEAEWQAWGKLSGEHVKVAHTFTSIQFKFNQQNIPLTPKEYAEYSMYVENTAETVLNIEAAWEAYGAKRGWKER